ncbi:MFS transporter [Paraburkholderia phenazinium]|jgi:EmrB/QacA subfamily drug resistance transporter|uniref:Drug resistance transporter, EmrB/QacA subfamily n=1 Tax=Paraburkholderia phenazinium TaxID=60549 RepID=A0A1G8ASD7_9BURK|nr:MFS transporter [Paraburkholderia phenazinium]SDH23837.1 drug resistance transporter, EmrB/QacA subfamily [Paraburkholderia phenazinium]
MSEHRDSARYILATASATCALIVLDTNVVAVSLPSIARTFQASFADVEWVVSAYMVAFASCLLPAGGLADRFGRKRMLLLGLAVFFLASLGCGLAPSAALLDLARAAKGVGAAMLLTAALAVIANTFHEGPERIRAWAVWGTCMGLATTVAPLVGGVITQWLGWRWIFLLNLPVCAVLAASASRFIKESRNPAAGPIDAAGSALFGLALALGIWALIEAPAAGWASWLTGARLSAAALLLVGFIQVQRLRAHAMVDLALFRQPRFVAAVLAMFGYAACAQVMMTFLPLYLQNAFGLSAIAAGLGMLPFALAMVAGPYLGAALARQVSSMTLLSAGLLLIGAGNLLTARVAGAASYGLVALGMVTTGLGAGLLNGDTQKAIMAYVPRNRTGMASGISTTTRFTAIVTSVGVLGAVLAARTKAAFYARPEVTPAIRRTLDTDFLSRVLAGDIAQASLHLPPAVRASLAGAAHASFASGFAAALYLAAAAAAMIAVAVRWLANRASEEAPAHVSGCTPSREPS